MINNPTYRWFVFLPNNVLICLLLPRLSANLFYLHTNNCQLQPIFYPSISHKFNSGMIKDSTQMPYLTGLSRVPSIWSTYRVLCNRIRWVKHIMICLQVSLLSNLLIVSCFIHLSVYCQFYPFLSDYIYFLPIIHLYVLYPTIRFISIYLVSIYPFYVNIPCIQLCQYTLYPTIRFMSIYLVSNYPFYVHIPCIQISVLCQYTLYLTICFMSIYLVSIYPFYFNISCIQLSVLCQYTLYPTIRFISIYLVSKYLFYVNIPCIQLSLYVNIPCIHLSVLF